VNITVLNPAPMNESSPLTMPYKDRSTGLMIFGGLTTALGCLVGLFVPLMLFGQAIAASVPNAPQTSFPDHPARHIHVRGFGSVIGMAGIGSIMARRWLGR